MAASRTVAYVFLSLGLLGSLAAVIPLGSASRPGPAGTRRVVRRPAWPSPLDEAPAEVRDFLKRVQERIPDHGAGIAGFRFEHWPQPGKPTREAIGLKAVPDIDPETLIARVMDVDGYPHHIGHVAACRSVPDPAFTPPGKVRCFQAVRVPRVVTVQQELVLVDAGTIKGYRVACWYLLKDQTRSLDPAAGARSAFNVGAWLAAPGVVGYALSTWPERADVNLLQWVSLTAGANALARQVIENNIDDMAAWAQARQSGPQPDRRGGPPAARTKAQRSSDDGAPPSSPLTG